LNARALGQVCRLAARAARAPAGTRYFERGSQRALRGWEAAAPRTFPSREYLLYVPRNHSPWRQSPLVVLCHGFKQTPEDIARGSRIAAFADLRGYLVLLPRQKDRANAWVRKDPMPP
jgi:poly(3-hydroxybutyrate) depolymerase